jgi:membrane-associated PAP2 superfamily phosphatase
MNDVVPPRPGLRHLFEPPALLADPIVQCLVMVVLTSLFFLLFPYVDLWFTGLFYSEPGGFVVRRLEFFQGLRGLHSALTWVIGVGLLLVVVVKLAMPSLPSLVAPRDTLYILSTLAIAPGLLVNGVFKSHWGRPRPAMITDFGGDNPFVGVWQISNYCDMNCSFVSGEASSAVWLLATVVLFPRPLRPLASRLILTLAILFAINRVAFGAHFLSDVLLSWWMTLAVMAAAYRILYISPPEQLTNDRLEGALTDGGNVIRSFFRNLVARLRPGGGSR